MLGVTSEPKFPKILEICGFYPSGAQKWLKYHCLQHVLRNGAKMCEKQGNCREIRFLTSRIPKTAKCNIYIYIRQNTWDPPLRFQRKTWKSWKFMIFQLFCHPVPGMSSSIIKPIEKATFWEAPSRKKWKIMKIIEISHFCPPRQTLIKHNTF